MAEHVGQAMLPVVRARLYDLLRRRAGCINHAISRKVASTKTSAATPYHRYVFPDGELRTGRHDDRAGRGGRVRGA